jgi:diguanylate cyclase (GGDEF)-like protein
MSILSRQPNRAFADPLDGTYWSPVGRISAIAREGVSLDNLDRIALRETMDKLSEAEEMIQRQQERIAFLESLTMTDELTGLFNRRGFNAQFRRALMAARRNGTGGGVLVVIDLDGFKGINDTHGHLAGDAYLRQVARLLTSFVRGHDVVARFGGDEFAVLLTDTDSESGAARAQQIATAAEQRSLAWNGHALPIRFSIGVHPYGPQDHEEDVIRQADVQMYGNKAKRRRLPETETEAEAA